nr:MarR family transcriptional regulator [Halopseudomonas xiamenensis]
MNSHPPDKDSPTCEYDFTQQVGYLLRRAYQRHTEIFLQNSADPQLTSTQFVTLCALCDHGPSSQAELIKATAIDQGTIRGLIERLGKRGLIEVRAAEDDKRKVIVHITGQGRELHQRMVSAALRITELTSRNLNQAERLALSFLLEKMLKGDE